VAKKTAALVPAMVISLHASQGIAETGITILDVYDNLGYQEGLKTDHVFSCLIRRTEKTILFDPGAHCRILA